MGNTNVDNETGQSMNKGRSPRFTLWVAFFVFSTITLGASVQIKNDAQDPNEAAKYAVACSAFTFAVSAIICLMHLISVTSPLIVGTVTEGLVSFILVGFWAAIVAIVTKTSNELAFVSAAQEMNANLFFFSWAGFVTSLVLFVNFLKSAMGMDLLGEMNQRGARLTFWAALLATCFIVMGSSLRVLNDECSTENMFKKKENYCNRTEFGVALGAAGFSLALLVLSLKLFCRTSAPIYEFVPAMLLTIANGVGVGLLTSNDGPGSSIGNLYFGLWFSFLVAGAVTAECINQFKSGAYVTADDKEEKDATDGTDFVVENLEVSDNV